MARIIAGIGASHTPTIGFAKDTKSADDPAWAGIFRVFRPVTEWLAAKRPDVLFLIYNDHITSFFLDHYSPFALGVDDRYVTADEGGGPRDYPAVTGHAALARHIGASLFADEFDISFFQKKAIDHGLFSPLSMMTDRGKAWDGAIVPLQVGVLQFPIPTARRCYRLGKRSGKRSRATPRTCRSPSSQPAGSRTRCTASAAASTIRTGMRSSSTCWRRIPLASPKSRMRSTRSAAAWKAPRSSCG